ncbi:MAG: VacB/RNase II family 3'-5' exoribonuclease, partial [Nitrospinaceae bacterium]|nr:VacB/RNase II family 3'-5' exoribonuclease [Nitrospinaceae bacterium]
MTRKPASNITDKEILDLLGRENRAMALRDMIRSLEVPADDRPAFRKRVRALSGDGVLIRVHAKFALPSSLSILVGVFRGHREGYGFVIADDEPGAGKPGADVFIKRLRTRGAMDGDRVAARVEHTHPDGRRDGSVVDVIEHAHKTLVGRLVTDRRRAWVEPQDKRIGDIIQVAASKRGGARNGEWVEVEIETYPGVREDARGVITRAFGYPDDPAVEQEMIIAKWGIREDFQPAAIKEAEGLKPPGEDEPFPRGVADLRELETFTIDPRTARDHDDALSIEALADGGRRLGVHIADVSHYVRAGHETDKEAALRGNSVYFPDRAIPMLPPCLSGDVCSLREGEVRRVLSAFLDFDDKGRQVDFRLTVARIRSSAQLTYAGAGAVLEGEEILEREEYEKALSFRGPLAELAALAGQLRARRMTEGSLDFDLPEPIVHLNEKGHPTAIERSPRNEAHRLVEECMLAANRAVAKMLEDAEGAAVYRVHAPPDEESIELLRRTLARLGLPDLSSEELMKGTGLQAVIDAAAGKDIERYVNMLVLRSMRLACYEPDPGIHFGLGFEPYTHFTSPIRRYADLLVHRRLKRLMRGDRRKPNHKNLASICAEISERGRQAELAEREMKSFLKALFMRDYIDQRCTGHVSGVTGFGVFVELDENFVEGMIPLESMTDDYYIHLPEEHSVLG